MPYGYSDAGVRIAIVKLDDLLHALLDHPAVAIPAAHSNGERCASVF